MRGVRSKLIAVTVGAALLAPVAARATTFDVSGTALNVGIGLPSCAQGSACPFSGTLTIDVTSGMVTAIDVTFPGLSDFDMLTGSGPFQTSDWFVTADNSGMHDLLALEFTTTKTPGSLVGFTGGTIFDGQVLLNAPPGLPTIYAPPISGSIAPVPEPSSLTLIASALLGLGVIRRRRRLLQRETV